MYPKPAYPGFTWQVTQHAGVVSPDLIVCLLRACSHLDGKEIDIPSIDAQLAAQGRIPTVGGRSLWRDYQQVLSEFGFIVASAASGGILRLTPIAKELLAGSVTFQEAFTVQLLRYQYANGFKKTIPNSVTAQLPTELSSFETLTALQNHCGVCVRPVILTWQVLDRLGQMTGKLEKLSLDDMETYVLRCKSHDDVQACCDAIISCRNGKGSLEKQGDIARRNAGDWTKLMLMTSIFSLDPASKQLTLSEQALSNAEALRWLVGEYIVDASFWHGNDGASWFDYYGAVESDLTLSLTTSNHQFGWLFPSFAINYHSKKNRCKSMKSQGIEARQLITYGAPGSGKSWSVKEWTKDKDTIRTTFHPDSDYSTFVGSYKPSMESHTGKKLNRHLTLDQLASILKSEYDLAGEGSDKGKALAVDLFAEEYFEYLDGEFGKVSLMELVNKAGLTKGYTVGLRDSINVAKHHALQRRGEKKIVYKFIPQSFIKAYVDAWKHKSAANGGEATRKYLVIEEINRGNCAQIFGDLFQLLDRNDEGFSDYEIAADDDLQNYLAEQFADLAKQNETAPINLGVDAKLAKRILSGEVMLLPENLYIWATMNTSDQSLFPIDSAFKRRWEWKYMPIYDAQKDYKIVVDGDVYKWWDFLEKANALVQEFTDSEDKKLGYFFCKADASNTIPLEQFVGKVIFYLWNDVFKDAGFDHAAFDGDNGERLLFKTFFNPDGSPKAATVKKLMQNLGVEGRPCGETGRTNRPDDDARTEQQSADA